MGSPLYRDCLYNGYPYTGKTVSVYRDTTTPLLSKSWCPIIYPCHCKSHDDYDITMQVPYVILSVSMQYISWWDACK